MPKVKKSEVATAIQGIEADEVYLLTEKEHGELLENFKKNTIETELKSRIAKVYDDVDADFEALTGLKKPVDQKTYKYWPEVFKQEKAKAAKLEADLAELKKNGSPDLQKEIDTLRRTYQEKDKEWQQKVDKLTGDLTTKDITATLNSSMAGLKFQELPQTVLDTFIESAKNKLAQSAKIIEGEVVFLDKDGNPRLNKATFKPYTAAELMALELDPVINKGKEPDKGAGSKPPKIEKDKDGKPTINLIIPVNVTTKQGLTKFLVDSGLPLNTEEHALAYDKYSANLPI